MCYCVSEDKTYLEYSASPSSFLSLSVKKLLELSQPGSAHWPKVEWNWRVITKIILANLVLLLLLLLLEGIFFNCENNKLGRAHSRTSYYDTCAFISISESPESGHCYCGLPIVISVCYCLFYLPVAL